MGAPSVVSRMLIGCRNKGRMVMGKVHKMVDIMGNEIDYDGGREIRNTRATSGMQMLLASMMGAGGVSGAIEVQEAQGQRELVGSTQLPTKISPDDRKAMVEAGVVFGDVTPGDKLFCQATLPSGWVKRATDHSMWSELVDASGKVRASIFYKAAFYDRSAFIRLAS